MAEVEKYLNSQNQTGCAHKWEYIGHGHNYSCYKCALCKLEDDY